MIQVKYRTDGKAHSLVITGHAGYAEIGDDIVCAGVSAIVYTLLGWMENNDEELEHKNVSIESGDVLIYCEGGEKAATAFDMTAIGLEQIAQRYPDNVVIQITGFSG